MNQYKFGKNRNLVKYCPCGKSNGNGKFAPFEGFEKYGYCHSCDQTFYPDNDTIVKPIEYVNISKPEPRFHGLDLVEKTVLECDDKNYFFRFLGMLFSPFDAEEALKKYLIGSWSNWNGITVFWQIDQHEKVHHGKLMMYNAETGKRVVGKDGKGIVSSVRSRLKIDKTGFSQCLFGLHLINESSAKVVALIESEKSAIIMSLFKPEYIWMSTGGKGGFKFDFLKPIKEYKIVAFPDKGVYDIWLEKAIELNGFGFNIEVNHWLEQQNEFEAGSDLADVYIIGKRSCTN